MQGPLAPERTAETVCGPIPVSSLGHAQLHEHVFVERTPAADSNPALCIDSLDLSAQELIRYAKAGGRTLLDAQPLGAGRNAGALRLLSEISGVNIIAVTGYHLAMFYPEASPLMTAAEEVLYAQYLRELDAGMDGTACRAGAVKAAIPKEGPVGRYRTLLRAAALAAARRDVPLLLHTEAGAHALEAIELAALLGLAPKRLLLCHADRQATDLAYHELLAKTGVWLEYDTIARPRCHSDERERELILHMLDRGYGGQLLLSLDTTAKRLAAYGGEIGLDYLLGTFLPMLNSAGADWQTIRALTLENPARVFA